ncbi:MAG: N-acetylmuramoyl-L-alanine amidase [Lachnospiraceae bacterium]|nr:N-acetylmuramoyl-L-alanine amidase [Lachnospiraceae bacterium]
MSRKKFFSLLLLIFAMLLTGCKGKQTEESPVVTQHDFSVQQWADYYDSKNENGGPTSAVEYFLNKGNLEAGKISPTESPDSASGESGEQTSDTEISQEVLDTVAALLSGAPLSSVDKPGESDNDTEKEQPVSAPDNSGKKTVIVIDPGHGGEFAGATYNGVTEQTITLVVAKYVKEYLLDNYSDVEVYLTRESDVDFADNLKDDLENRCIIAKRHGADALVSIHFNASESHDQSGANIYVSRRDNVSATSHELAESIMKQLTALGLKNRGIEERKSNDMFDEKGDAYDYYAINRHCAARNIPGIIVEQCFIDSDTDREFMKSDAALKKLGTADAIGIAEYYGLKKK